MSGRNNIKGFFLMKSTKIYFLLIIIFFISIKNLQPGASPVSPPALPPSEDIENDTYHQKIKAMWVTPWDIDTKQKVLKIVENAIDWGVTDLLVEVRYRGDALYKPNKVYSDFQNSEPLSYILRNNPDFDALETFIHYTRDTHIKIHAWVTVNVITTRRLDTIQPTHLYYTHPHWLTYHSSGRRIHYDQFEGAFLDPGVPDVKNYLINIFADIVQNYDIDGFHLDYIRYPGNEYGHNPISLERFNRLSSHHSIISFQRWKELQLNELVQRIGETIKSIKPNLLYTAAVFPNIDTARNRYAQNWYEWLDNNFLDYTFIMAYQTRNNDFEQIVDKIPERFREKVVIGLRAWSDEGTYGVQNIIDKIKMIPRNYPGICFFSYGGIVSRNYQSAVIDYMVGETFDDIKDTQSRHLLDTVVYHDQHIYLNIASNHNIGVWVLYDVSDNVLAKGQFSDFDKAIMIPDKLLEDRYLVLKYEINGENFIKLIDLH